jgi:hypothetical protein
MRRLWVLACCFIALPCTADVTLRESPRFEFNPAQGERFDLTFAVAAAGRLQVELQTEDGDRVRELLPDAAVQLGLLPLSWDGRDDAGVLVWRWRGAGREQLHDPRAYSGGEILTPAQQRFADGRQLSFVLPEPARVLARIGVKGGPMLRTLAEWVPYPAGAIRLVWDGHDQSGVEVTGAPVSALAIAYRLPRHAIITRGNTVLDYARYRRQKGWSFRRPVRRALARQRDGQALAPAYFEPRYQPVTPDISLRLQGQQLRRGGVPLLREPVVVSVNVAETDRWTLEHSQFEVAFFIDHQFHSEEEQGYVPFHWLLDPYGLAPGRHMLTVNLSGFDGQVGAASLVFEVP